MKKILIIEDEKVLREEISEILTFEGYEPVLAENGKIGLEMAQKHSPNLILCDIMMPEVDGKRVLYELRAQEKTTLIPFIFMSALAERESIRDGMSMGADDYLTKPFSRKELIQTIEARLRKQEARMKMTDHALDSLRNQIMTTLPHELRTPLSSIIGFGSILNDISDILTPKEIADMGKEILDGGHRLHRLIENYLIYVQVQLNDITERGKLSGETINSIINETTQGLAKKFQWEVLPEVVIEPIENIAVAESIFRKVMQELIDNAYKFSDIDTPILIHGKKADDYFSFTIQDQGRGMTEEQISQIGAFMQFERKKHEQQGVGLGLSIAKKMVETSGGIFSIESQPEVGTEVKISFLL